MAPPVGVGVIALPMSRGQPDMSWQCGSAHPGRRQPQNDGAGEPVIRIPRLVVVTLQQSARNVICVLMAPPVIVGVIALPDEPWPARYVMAMLHPGRRQPVVITWQRSARNVVFVPMTAGAKHCQ